MCSGALSSGAFSLGTSSSGALSSVLACGSIYSERIANNSCLDKVIGSSLGSMRVPSSSWRTRTGHCILPSASLYSTATVNTAAPTWPGPCPTSSCNFSATKVVILIWFLSCRVISSAISSADGPASSCKLYASASSVIAFFTAGVLPSNISCATLCVKFSARPSLDVRPTPTNVLRTSSLIAVRSAPLKIPSAFFPRFRDAGAIANSAGRFLLV
ncbi:hypothetical protein DFH09DRAFT_1206616 [Mycena vulgaris]|nr:hypothetical protein DFH09DRAFT_1206616 [Mycena vulgaris]